MTPEIENKLKKEAALIITAMAKMQSALHTLDELTYTKGFTHELKKKTNSFMSYLEKECHRFANSKVMSVREADDYMRLVGEFDAIKLLLEINLEQ